MGKKKEKREAHDQKMSEYFNIIAWELHDLSSIALERGEGEHLLSSLYNQAMRDKKNKKAFVAALQNIVLSNRTIFEQKSHTVLGIDDMIGKSYVFRGASNSVCHPLVRKAVVDFARAREVRFEPWLVILIVTIGLESHAHKKTCPLPDDDRRSWGDKEKDYKRLEQAIFDYVGN